MRKISWPDVLFWCGVFTPLLVVLLFPGVYFDAGGKGDIGLFKEWAVYWNQDWHTLYLNCKICTYPFLATFMSAGVLNFLQNVFPSGAFMAFRLYIAFFDGLNVILIYFILKSLAVEKPQFWAGLSGIALSSWVGSTLWIQLDGVGQFLILLVLLILVETFKQEPQSVLWFRLRLAFTGVLVGCILLIKVLALFSVFSLGLFLLAGIIFYTRDWRQALLSCAIVAATTLITVLSPDLFLRLPSPYFSNILYIWKEGNYYNTTLTMNGFNLWIFSGRPLISSSFAPLFPGSPLSAPFYVGTGLFILYLIVITIALFLFLRRFFVTGERYLQREALFNFILHLALVNIGFNIFMTGTHERYLYHFYPFMFMAVSGLAGYNKRFSGHSLKALLFVCANLYGLFVLWVIRLPYVSFGALPILFSAVLHLSLFVYLLWLAFSYQEFAGNLRHLRPNRRAG